MEITYPVKEANVAELVIDGNPVRYAIPPKTGTHQEVFQDLSANERLTIAQGQNIVAYVHGALVHKQNEWANQALIRFPSRNYLRFPAVLTIIPKREEFGDLEGGMLVDSDLEGQGIAKQTVVPKDLSGWEVSEGGIFVNEGRMFLPHDKWYQEQWGADNAAAISLCGGLAGAEALVRTAKDSGRIYRPLSKVNPEKISSPERRVPILHGCDDYRLVLDCDSDGDFRDGCGIGVLN